MLLWIIGFSTLGSVGAVACAALFLFFPERIRKVLVPCLISYATGTLLGAAFLGMIPAGLKQAPGNHGHGDGAGRHGAVLCAGKAGSLAPLPR